MKLWIRSQNKMKLRIVIDLGIFEEQEGYTIYCDDSIDNILGTYSTEKRALEVLDEIQNILKPTIKINYEYDDSLPIMNGEWLKSVKSESKIEELSTYVYEMPKE